MTNAIDIMTVRATTPQFWTQLRDGKLVSFWVPQMLVPGYRDPIAISENGKMLECDTYQEAAGLARDRVAEWQAKAQQAQQQAESDAEYWREKRAEDRRAELVDRALDDMWTM